MQAEPYQNLIAMMRRGTFPPIAIAQCILEDLRLRADNPAAQQSLRNAERYLYGHELAQKLTPSVVICNLRRPLLARLDYYFLSLHEIETLQWLNRILARLEER